MKGYHVDKTPALVKPGSPNLCDILDGGESILNSPKQQRILLEQQIQELEN